MPHPYVQEPDAGEAKGLDLIRDCNRRDEGRQRLAQQELLTANPSVGARRPPAKFVVSVMVQPEASLCITPRPVAVPAGARRSELFRRNGRVWALHAWVSANRVTRLGRPYAPTGGCYAPGVITKTIERSADGGLPYPA